VLVRGKRATEGVRLALELSSELDCAKVLAAALGPTESAFLVTGDSAVPFRPSGLESAMRALFEDPAGRLWIGTEREVFPRRRSRRRARAGADAGAPA
jgi:hypothetical protein